MKKKIYTLLIKDWPLIKTPWCFEKRFQITPNYNYTVGFGFNIGKWYLRQGITIYLPLICLNFYIHSYEKAKEIWDRNNFKTEKPGN